MCNQIKLQNAKEIFNFWLKIFQLIFFIVAITVALIPIWQYFYNSNVSVEFNRYYILCYRNTGYGNIEIEDDEAKVTSEYSYFDSLTLNFALMNNNPLRNFFVNNIYLYISDKEGVIDKLVEGKAIDKEEIYFNYQAQYNIDEFKWENVKTYGERTSSFEVLGIPSNDVKVYNIEFYPVGWYDKNIAGDRYNFKGNTKYYIVLYTEDYNGNKTFLNKDKYLEIKIYNGAINYLKSFYPEEMANIY